MPATTTFYEIKNSNQIRTIWLLLLFPIMILSISFLACFVAANFESSNIMQAKNLAIEIFIETVPITIIGASIWMIIALFYGKKMVLGFAGATPLKKSENPELFRIVENLSIRTGITMPKLYIINDDSLNAFATGYSPDNASVAITKGLLKKLNKSEIEAVMAHEFGHILNRDTRVMLIAITMVGIIQLLAEIILRIVFRGMLHKKSSNNKNNGQLIIILIVVSIIIWLIAFLGAIFVQMGISRKREFMADAESANLTRHPLALVSALEKISQDARVEVLDGKRSIAAMCIADPLQNKQSFTEKLTGLFASHPPVSERIKILKNF